jgi:hypothetical protein
MKAVQTTLVLSVLVLLVACGKDKFETKPLLEIKDYSAKDIYPGQDLVIRINYFDKEGDLSQTPFTAIRRRTNINPPSSQFPFADTLIYTLPEFPAKDNGEISFHLNYDFLRQSTVENDTLHFRFSVVDKAGNVSDTVVSDQIIIRNIP